MPNFDFLEKGPALVSQPHIYQNAQRIWAHRP